MNHLAFVTADPLDTVPRVLDHARKSSFRLLEIGVTLRPEGRYDVRISFGPAGAISFDTLAALCERLVDISSLVCVSDLGCSGLAVAAPLGSAQTGGPCLPN